MKTKRKALKLTITESVCNCSLIFRIDSWRKSPRTTEEVGSFLIMHLIDFSVVMHWRKVGIKRIFKICFCSEQIINALVIEVICLNVGLFQGIEPLEISLRFWFCEIHF